MKLKITTSIILLFALEGCEQLDTKFTVVNNSPDVISYYLTNDSSGNLAIGFFATNYYKTPDGMTPKEMVYVRSKDSCRISTIGAWESDSSLFQNGTAYIYVIDPVNIGKDSAILERDQLIRKYPVTMAYMKAHNWTKEVK